MELTLLLPLLASLQSLPRPVSPTDLPKAPAVHLSPQYELYFSGQHVWLTCSAPCDAEAATRFQFYKDGGSIFPPAVPPGSSYSHVRNLELGPECPGPYTCRYWTGLAGWEIQSAESAPVSISVTDRLPAPTLSLEPRYQAYLPGERVTLTCAAPQGESVLGYRFYFQNEEQGPSTVLSSNIGARLKVTAEKGRAGSYTCAYWRPGSNGQVSEKSSSVSITVRDLPKAPAVHLSPQYELYFSGQHVWLTCSAPCDAEAATRFQFYKDGGSIFPPAVPPGSSYSHVRNLELGPECPGPYTCRYWTGLAGREIQSAESAPVSISVTDRLPAPTLSLEPRYQAYLPGERVTLTCAAPQGESVLGYRFYFQNEEQGPSTVLSSNVGARLKVTAEKGRAGSYTCAYWRPGSNGQVSEKSSSVSITVRDLPKAPAVHLSPQYELYFSGQHVWLTCSAPCDAEAATRFQFYKDGGSIFPPAVPPGSSYSHVRNLELGPECPGPYTCRYWTGLAGREIQSAESAPVSISVTDRLPAPTLSLEPRYQAYLPGERVTLTCAAPQGESVLGYRFYFQNEEQGPSTVLSSNVGARLKVTAEKGRAGSYTCAYWRPGSNGQVSEKSSSVSITVRDRPSAPKLPVSPQYCIVLRGESVTLTCSAPRTANVSRIRFFRDGQRISSGELQRSQNSVNASVQLSSVSKSHAGEYSCEYWEAESGREIPSERSQNFTIKVTDPPPQPVLSVDPPSGVLSERLPLLLTCTVTGSAREQRFHFYRNGAKFDPGDMGSELSTSEPTNSSMNISVLSIVRAGPENTGEFTCGYEQKAGRRWIPSPRSRAVTVTLTGSHRARDILLGTGGVLLLIAALAALICYCRRKKRVPKTLKSTDGSALGEHARNLDPGHDSKGSKATGTGAEQMEQGSEVTYALIDFQAHKTQLKNKAKPAEDEHVLYSEVVTTRTQKAAK